MKQNENNGLYTDLNIEELLTINGGSALGEAIAQTVGWVFGAYSRTMEKYGDHANWTI
jgi:hypothetical protein